VHGWLVETLIRLNQPEGYSLLIFYNSDLLIIGLYLFLFSISIHRRITKSGPAIGRPDWSLKMWMHIIPTITGSKMIAPNALVLEGITRIPPIISTKPTSGISQLICVIAPMIVIKLAGRSFGTGM